MTECSEWRPSSLDEFVGQEPLVRQLRVELEAARRQNRALRHMLLAGAQGLGKTTLAAILSMERWGFDPIVLMGKSLTHEQLTYTLLTLQSDGYHPYGFATDRRAMKFPVLVLDECECVPRPLFEVMHPVLEPGADGRRIFMARSRSGEIAERWCREHTWIFLTNFAGDLLKASPATASRLPIQYTFEWYTDDEMVRVLRQYAGQAKLKAEDGAVRLLASRSNGMPRSGLNLLRRAVDFATVVGDGTITAASVNQMFDTLGIDENGLDRPMVSYLKTLASQPSGRMSAQGLAAILGLDPNTLMYQIEPVLMKRGLISRGSGGREITAAGRVLINGAGSTDPFWSGIVK